MKKFIAAYLIVFVFSIPTTGNATGMPVLDISNLVQNIFSVVQQLEEISALAETVTTQYTQITKLESQIDNQIKNLERLAGSDWGAFSSLLTDIQADITAITGSADSLKYNSGTIQANYDSVYKKDYSTMTPAERAAALANMDTSIHEVTYNAMRSQTAVERIKTSSQKAKDILAQSDTADGDVRQLQSLNQMSSLNLSALNDLLTVSATTGRVVAAEQARAAEERKFQKAVSNDLRKNYTDRGAPSVKDIKFPGM